MDKKNILNVVVTGYYGSGSSAVVDLLAEFKGAQICPLGKRVYEHVPFYISGGLFNLCSVLTRGNTPLVSDGAVNSFLDAMNKLNVYDFGWFGGYNSMFGNEFENNVNDFISSIAEKFEGGNVNHNIRTAYKAKSVFFQILSSLHHLKFPIKLKPSVIVDNKPSYHALPTDKEFYCAAREFTDSYFELFKVSDSCYIRIFDHVVLPQQIDEFKDCFKDNVKFIVLERDPRDVYVSNKYIYSATHKPYFPIDPTSFSNKWRRIINSPNKSDNVIVLRFEDLIYNYSSTLKDIEDFLNLPNDEHIFPRKYFNPDISINNTQLYNSKIEWNEDIPVLQKELSGYLYNFPYDRIGEADKAFSFDQDKVDGSSKKV